MSDETKKAMDDAIAAHFSDIGDGRMVVGYSLQIKAIDLNDEGRRTWYKREMFDDQSFETSLGLFQIGILGLEDYWRSPDD